MRDIVLRRHGDITVVTFEMRVARANARSNGPSADEFASVLILRRIGSRWRVAELDLVPIPDPIGGRSREVYFP
jgi:hypothetical protein